MVSFKPYSLGTMMFGWRIDKVQACKVMSLALDNEVTLIDSSVSYARGACHAMLADVIKTLGCAKKIQIATKVGGVACESDPEYLRGLSAFNIRRQCDLSLRQLGVDAIDLMQLHFFDSSIALEHQVEVLQNLQSIGKIKAWGVCNYTTQQMMDLYQCAKKIGGSLPISNQMQFNIINDQVENDLTFVLEKCQMNSMVWGVLSSGLLTNRTAQYFGFDPKGRIASGREKDGKLVLLEHERTRRILRRLIETSQITGVSIAQLAVAWVKRHKWVNTILLGPSSVEQFRELLAVQRLNIDLSLLDESA